MNMNSNIGPTMQTTESQSDKIHESRSGVDSGYGTQTVTPESTPQTPTQGSSQSISRVLKYGSSLCEDLSEFDAPVDDDTICRFTNIQLQIERPLLKYVQKVPGKYRSMAIRLMVLGITADQAKPHIVVLVADEQCRRVRKFFDKSSVRALVRPRDETLPSFEILIYGRPPDPKQADGDGISILAPLINDNLVFASETIRPRDEVSPSFERPISRRTAEPKPAAGGGISVLAPLINGNFGFTSETFCGAPIIIRHKSGVEKRATFGGIIKAVDEYGVFKLYGLTAGHVVEDSNDDISIQSYSDMISGNELYLSESECDSDTDDDCDSDSRTSTNESYQSSTKRTEDPESIITTNEREKVIMFQDAWSSTELGSLGIISKDSPQVRGYSGKQRPDISANFDWALIEMSKYKPNRICPREHRTNGFTQPITFGDLVMPKPSLVNTGNKRSVFVISGSEGLKKGTISPLPSRILLGPGKEFVNALIINLNKGKDIVDGDSGSWVVDERTLMVYGHIVATDSFGGGYIIPLEDTFCDIAKYLQVTLVEIASLVDITCKVMDDMNLVKAGCRTNDEEYRLLPPLSSRYVTASPSRGTPTPEARELTRQRDQARRDSKNLVRARLALSSTSCSSNSPPVTIAGFTGAPALPIYSTLPSQIPLLAEPVITVPGSNYIPSYSTSPLPETGASMFQPFPPLPSSAYMGLEYNPGFAPPPPSYALNGHHYNTGRPPSMSDPGMLYPVPQTVLSSGNGPSQETGGHVRVVKSRPKPQCWEHGCNGRQFSTFSNLLRHQREKSGQAVKATCPNCGAEFTRTTARNGHLLHDKCRSRRND